MTNEEVLERLREMKDNGERITFSDLEECISTRSVVDYVANSNAITIFYSGESETLINTLSSHGGADIRMIRRTEAFAFVVDEDFEDIVTHVVKQEYPDLKTVEEIGKKVEDLFYKASYYDTHTGSLVEGKGYWTEISRRFAADTHGDAYSLCSNASETRIFAMDELPAWLKNADDNAKMGGFTKQELLAMSETERFSAIKNWTIEDMKDTMVYINSKGEKAGQTFEGTLLEKYVDDVVPSEYEIEKSLSDYINDKDNNVADNDDSSSITESSEDAIEQGDETPDIEEEVDTNDTVSDTEKNVGADDEVANSEKNADTTEENVETNDEVAVTEENAETDEQVTDTTEPVDEPEKVTDTTEPADEPEKVTDTTEPVEEVDKVTDTTEPVEEPEKVTDTTEPADEPEKVTDTTESVEEVDKITDTTEPVDEPDKVTDITEDIDKEDTVIDESETIKDVDKVADNADIVEEVDDKINYDQTNDNTNFLSDDIGVDDIIHEAEVDNRVDLTDEGKKIVDAYEDASGNKVDFNSTPGMAKILNKLADAADKLGDAFDIFDAAYAVYNAVNLFAKGDKTGACKALSDYGFSTLGGMGAGLLATKLVTLCAINPLLGFATVFLVGFAGSVCGENISTLWFAKILGIYDEAGAYTFPVDPLILDLDGDGIETVSVENGVNFDFDSNGFAEKLGWVGSDDGLLVRGLNGNC